MKRFIGAAAEDFELMFIDDASASLEDALYPPCCENDVGPLRFRTTTGGAVMVEVLPCRIESPADFCLDFLFTNGSCPFGGPEDLARFWNGPIAHSFGVQGATPTNSQPREVTGPLEEVSVPHRRAGALSPSKLAARLGTAIKGQEAALGPLASLVVSQLSKRAPRRPATALLIGPTGVGKTTTIETLPAALAAEGWPQGHIHRIDCNELTSSYDVHRFLGSAPGLVGYTETPPLAVALRQEGCLVLLDEIDKAHPGVQAALYSLLDTGRIMAPDGTATNAPGAIVVMTSSDGADELESRLHRIALDDRVTVDRVVRAHLAESGWSSELIGRIDTVVVYHALGEDARREAATETIRVLAAEYGFSVSAVPPVLADVVLDIAADSDLRHLYYAARKLLGEVFASAAGDGFDRRVVLHAGPPPSLAPDFDS